jgi:hypothetical protein
VPIGANDNLDELYAKQRLLTEEASRLEDERDRSDPDGPDANRHYLLELQIEALRVESSRISAHISDILERDLQR